MSGLEGRVALVTGAAAGIGRAAADALAARGASVARVDVQPGGIQADVSKPDEVARAVGETVEAFGRLDVVVCAAGIQRYGSVVDTPEDVWDEVLAVNLKQMYLVGKHAVPHLVDDGGTIVNVASVQGLGAQRGVAAYAASKGGVIALTRAMAVDHAPAVRVNCVCPGSVDTPMLRSAAELFGPDDPDATVASWGDMHPLGRVARPEEVAEVIAFLAGPASSFMTGAAVLVDGGLMSVIGGT